ncbi:TPA: hypothetical protein ACULER_004817, partial [Escherichia coli]
MSDERYQQRQQRVK